MKNPLVSSSKEFARYPFFTTRIFFVFLNLHFSLSRHLLWYPEIYSVWKGKHACSSLFYRQLNNDCFWSLHKILHYISNAFFGSRDIKKVTWWCSRTYDCSLFLCINSHKNVSLNVRLLYLCCLSPHVLSSMTLIVMQEMRWWKIRERKPFIFFPRFLFCITRIWLVYLSVHRCLLFLFLLMIFSPVTHDETCAWILMMMMVVIVIVVDVVFSIDKWSNILSSCTSCNIMMRCGRVC